MDPPEITQYVKMEGCGFYRLGAALSQTIKMPFGGREFHAAQESLFCEQFAGLTDIAGHEDTEGDPQGFHRALVESRKFFGAFWRELKPALDLLGRQFAQILVYNVADVLKVNGKRDYLHPPLSLTFVEAAAGKFCDVELNRLVEAVDSVVHP
jgi:hypothetical protein